MSLRSRLRTWWRAVLQAGRLRDQVGQELEFHIEARAEELMRNGMGREQALRRARIELGSGERVREECNQASGGEPVRAFLGDLRYAVRTLRRSPGFALAALGTLALGIGAVTAVFSVVNTVLLKPFEFRDPHKLVVVRETEAELRGERTSIPVSYRHYLRLKTEAKTLEDAAIFQDEAVSVSPNGDRPEVVAAITSSPNLFRVLGVQPIMGRDFTATDPVDGTPQVAILSYAGWKRLTGGDPNAVGRTVRLNGDPLTVIGVLPEGVNLPQIAWGDKIAIPTGIGTGETMVFMPFAPSAWDLKQDTGNFNYKMIARLKPGVTAAAQAQAELETLQRAYMQSAHLPKHYGAVVTPLAADVTNGISGALWLMLAAVCGVLLIGCVNLANLQLARAVAAEAETAVRAALGASRGRLLRARLAESIVLSLAGGAAGVALAFVGMRGLLALAPADVPRLNEVHMSWPVLLFAAGLSIAAAVGFGLVPALKSTRVQPETALRANSTRSANSRESRRARSVLVGAQVTCTVALLLVTALVLRSFSRLLGQKLGFDVSHATLAVVELYTPQYDDKVKNVQAVKLQFTDRALEALRSLPGVQHVAVTSTVPLTGENWVDELVRPDHPLPEAQRPLINVRWISPEYMTAMRMPLVDGRNIADSDRGKTNAVMISERTAREGFGNEDPVGKKIALDVPGNDNTPATIVGVVADAKINGLKDSANMLYAPYWIFTPWTLSFVVRGPEGSGAQVNEIRRAIWNIDSQVAIPLVKPMAEQVSDSVGTERFQTLILSCFGAAALLLALLGVYGVLAYSVSLRRQEFGIRMALGSGRGALMSLVLRQAAGPVLCGVGAGLLVAFPLLRWMRGLLYQTSALDPVAIVGSLVLLLSAAALAATLPARRAALTDPAKAIRYE